MEKLSFTGESHVLIDSAMIDYGTQSVHFQLPHEEESVFQLRIKGEEPRIYFVTDVPEIDIITDRPDWKQYHFRNQGINNVLRAFLNQQSTYNDGITLMFKKHRPPAGATPFTSQDTIQKKAQELHLLIAKRDKAFADTVSSPGAFLFAYNRIDFGKNYTALKTLVTKAAARFPQHGQVQRLKQETINLVRIFEEEYNVGDLLPDVVLPNQNGKLFSLKSLRGQYVFLDLWASWCQPCIAFADAKKNLNSKYPDKLKIVSIAIDPEKEAWQQLITAQRIPGIHLIDEAGWRGTAAQAFKFDS
ncbi:MAG TPA: TlpA disulfide reductase family protein, partial [Flavisolibacter sp.]